MAEYTTKVTVELSNGAFRTFRSNSTYDSSCSGRVLVWNNVLIDGHRIDYLSIPVNMIVSVEEVEDE